MFAALGGERGGTATGAKPGPSDEVATRRRAVMTTTNTTSAQGEASADTDTTGALPSRPLCDLVMKGGITSGVVYRLSQVLPGRFRREAGRTGRP